MTGAVEDDVSLCVQTGRRDGEADAGGLRRQHQEIEAGRTGLEGVDDDKPLLARYLAVDDARLPLQAEPKASVVSPSTPAWRCRSVSSIQLRGNAVGPMTKMGRWDAPSICRKAMCVLRIQARKTGEWTACQAAKIEPAGIAPEWHRPVAAFARR